MRIRIPARALVVALALSVVTSLGVPMSASADYAAGVDAYDKGDYAAALRELEPLARADPRAAYYLGKMFSLGIGVGRDVDRGARYTAPNRRFPALPGWQEPEAMLLEMGGA